MIGTGISRGRDRAVLVRPGFRAAAPAAAPAPPPPPVISQRSRSRPPTSATTSTCSRARAATSPWRWRKNGIIMVDGQFAPLHDKIKAAIATLISNLPIKYLINTHYHGDHTGGNESFAKDGVTSSPRSTSRTRLAAGTTNGLTGAKTPPAPQGALPADTYTNFSKIRLPRPRRRPKAHPECAYRRRHLCLVQDRQRAVDRRHLYQWPLPQHRFCQWRQHQGHDRGGRRLSEA